MFYKCHKVNCCKISAKSTKIMEQKIVLLMIVKENVSDIGLKRICFIWREKISGMA